MPNYYEGIISQKRLRREGDRRSLIWYQIDGIREVRRSASYQTTIDSIYLMTKIGRAHV